MDSSVCQIDQVDCLVLFRSAMYLTVFLLVESCPLLLLLLSRFSRVQLCATPWTAAYQAPPSMGFSMARVLEWGAIAFSVSITERSGNSLHPPTRGAQGWGRRLLPGQQAPPQYPHRPFPVSSPLHRLLGRGGHGWEC